MKITADYVFFFTYKDLYSQHYPLGFDFEGIHFKTAEHWMMFNKACIMEFGKNFDFTEVREYIKSHPLCVPARILYVNHPQEAKKLGRQVANFNAKLWDLLCEDVVFNGNMLKFTQNAQAFNDITHTGDRLFVEASPYDRLWGIGLSIDDPRTTNPNQWLGKNKLGKVLTRVRTELRNAVKKH